MSDIPWAQPVTHRTPLRLSWTHHGKVRRPAGTRGQGQPSALLCRRDREGGGLYLGWDKGLLRQHLSAETKERAVRCRSNSAPLPLPQAAPAGRGGGRGGGPG